MLRKLAIPVVILAVIGVAVFWFVTMPATVSASALPAHTPNLENGKTMFYAGGCSSCHAIPNQEDKTKLGGGLGLKSPFGIFYAPNISPDRNDGIGDWSEANFVTAMLKGTSPDGSNYYPAFPYTSYQHMRMEDVRDLFAYLKTLPPVQGKVRGHDLPIYLKYRRLVGAGNSFSSMASHSSPIPPNQRNGTAVLISSTVQATARSVTVPAICSAPSSQASASPAVRIRKAATVGFPTLRRRGSVITRNGTSSVSSKPATCRTAIRSVALWPLSSAIRRSSRPRIAPRSRTMSNRCRRSKDRSIRNGDRR